MDTLNNYSDLQKEKQNQILKLVTKSFFKELSSYGVDKSDIVKVSVNLLDHVTHQHENDDEEDSLYNKIFDISDVENTWTRNASLTLANVTIKPLESIQVAKICEWLKEADIKQTFISYFPKDQEELTKNIIGRMDKQYFAIFNDKDAFVGIIGAENINEDFKKLEMKKFIGAKDSQGKGTGKAATFLFLYYVFQILGFNKVYIHSLETNIKNINLNSKFGFELEGILYDEANVGGVFKDVLRMGLLRKDWQRIFALEEK